MPSSDWFADALLDEGVRRRYWAKVYVPDEGGCWYWTGAISGKGHGRFWIGQGRVVIAHRFGYALAHPGEPMPPMVGHRCDNPICQSPEPGHMEPSTAARNRAEWVWRRDTVGGPLRDVRGALGRAIALRDAARKRADLDAAESIGRRPVDRDQSPLW